MTSLALPGQLTETGLVRFKPKARPKLEVRPISLRDANRFVGRLHRHHPPARGCRFCVAAWASGVMVAVAIVGRPVARASGEETAEVVRLCSDGTWNACSLLYAACARAAAALGYCRIQTYILASEPGTSLKAAGWVREAETPGRAWDHTSASQLMLTGGTRTNAHPLGKKVRWGRNLK